jgi:hypothetical protein
MQLASANHAPLMVAEAMPRTFQEIRRRCLPTVCASACMEDHSHLELILGVLRGFLDVVGTVLQVTRHSEPRVKAGAALCFVWASETYALVIANPTGLFGAMLDVLV